MAFNNNNSKAQTTNDEVFAHNLQQAELGQGTAAQGVHQGVVIGVPVQQTHPAALPRVAVLVSDLRNEELIALNYSGAVSCFAAIDAFFTLFNGVSYIENAESQQDWPFWFGVGSLLFLLGPFAGLFGARMLNLPLTAIYFIFCLVKLGWYICTAIFSVFFWFLLFAVVQVWITKLVGTFTFALARIGSSRRQELRKMDVKDAVRMVYW
jgi:hypothetical protein